MPRWIIDQVAFIAAALVLLFSNRMNVWSFPSKIVFFTLFAPGIGKRSINEEIVWSFAIYRLHSSAYWRGIRGSRYAKLMHEFAKLSRAKQIWVASEKERDALCKCRGVLVLNYCNWIIFHFFGARSWLIRVQTFSWTKNVTGDFFADNTGQDFEPPEKTLASR